MFTVAAISEKNAHKKTLWILKKAMPENIMLNICTCNQIAIRQPCLNYDLNKNS